MWHMLDSSSSSSSSSSDDENYFIEITLPEVLLHHQKNELYAENIVPLYTDNEFNEHFRVSRNIVTMLAGKLETSVYYSKFDKGHLRVTPEKCILIFCWYAGHEAASFRDVADRFDVAISTLHEVIEKITFLISGLSSQIIQWPKPEEKTKIENDFRALGFPGVLGCVDGTHIMIDKPTDDPDSYINRKKYYSIQMQAVCDSKRKITDVFIGYPGSVHDSRVFRTSPLYDTIQQKCLDKYILADSAYPCLRNCLTPYRNTGNLTAVETNFNLKLSSCRILIEHTFGMLKQRFRQLYHLKLRNVEVICHFIRACCVLHNMLLSEEEELNPVQNGDDNDVNAIPNANDQVEDEDDRNEVGHNFRNYVAAMLYNEL